MNLQDSTVFVTGGSGFLGSHIVDLLRQRGARVLAPARKQLDLLNRTAVDSFLREYRPEVVVHAAACIGGIGFTRTHPGTTFYENILMNTQMMEACRLAGVEKFVGIGSVCAYPKTLPLPFSEDDLWLGYPEETNAPYGLAKKMMLVQAQAYRQEFGFNAIHLLMVNMYGPRDKFDPRWSHVIPALMRKCLEAKEQGAPVVEVWGDGSPTREFLYVGDAAEAVVLATEKYDSSEPVNIGSGEEISIRELAVLIAELTGFDGEFSWQTQQPNGQPRRILDVSRAQREFGFKARIRLREGLQKTLDWYVENREQVVR